MDSKTSSSNKRGGNVISRRVGQAPSDEVRPMLLPVTTTTTMTTGSSKASCHTAAPPRSGQFILPMFVAASGHVSDHSRDHKRHYRVNLPIRMLSILAMVFLAVPLMIFLYKEVHMNDDNHTAHFKSEKFVNVNTREVISQFSNHAQQMKHEWDRDDVATSEDETDEANDKDKAKSSADLQADEEERDMDTEPEVEQAETAQEEQPDHEAGSPEALKEENALEGMEEIDDEREGKNDEDDGNDKGGEAGEENEKSERINERG